MVVVLVGAFVASFAVPMHRLALVWPDGAVWTLATHWLGSSASTNGFVGALFGALIVATLGTTVERSLGSARWLALWLVASIVAGIGLMVGGQMFGPSALLGPWPPLMALVMEWCLRNGNSQVLLMGFIPVSARVLGLLAPLLAALGVMGPVASMIVTAAALYGLYFFLRARPGLVEQRKAGHQTPARMRREAEYYDDVRRREKDRAERERLRQMLESSLDSDDESKP